MALEALMRFSRATEFAMACNDELSKEATDIYEPQSSSSLPLLTSFSAGSFI